jgi:hypothetical protein
LSRLFEEVGQAAAKGEPLSALCQMTDLSRAGFYRWRTPREATQLGMEICDQTQKVADLDYFSLPGPSIICWRRPAKAPFWRASGDHTVNAE